MVARINLEGQVYGKLTVLSFSHKEKSSGHLYYTCRCSCGVEKVIRVGNLRSGSVKSCGCMRGTSLGKNYIHGKSKTKVYITWVGIIERCTNENSPFYAVYKGKLSEVFRNSFQAFYDEIGEPPSPKHSVDRIDNNRGYEPGNIRWATACQQTRNRGKSKANKSGVTGVRFYEVQNPNGTSLLYAMTIWSELETYKQKVKYFSVKKYGLLPAFKMAVEYRNKMLLELNEQGAGYSENHGK